MKTSTGERLNPLNDFLFFKVMGEKGDEIQLLGFLNAVLGRTDKNRFTSVKILENKNFSPEIIGNKASILDVRAKLQDGSRVNVEVQLRNLGNMEKRSIFYWSKEYGKGIKAGQDYIKLENVIVVNILDFDYLETNNFHTVFHLREDTENRLILTDVLEIHFLNMVKWRRIEKKEIVNEPLYRWLAWFDKTSPQELVTEVINMDSAIQKAEERQDYILSDEDALRLYEMRQMAQMDLTSGLNQARREGIQEGIKEGKKEEKLEIARKLKSMDIPILQISESTGLAIEVVKKL